MGLNAFGFPFNDGVGNGLSSSCSSSSTTLGVMCIYYGMTLPLGLYADDISESLVLVNPIKSRDVSEPVTDGADGGLAKYSFPLTTTFLFWWQ